MEKIVAAGTEYTLGNIINISTITFDERATMAYKLIERWGMVAATPDGEDSAGRSKLRLCTPDEMVERAFKTVDLFFGGAEARGMVLHTTKEELESIKLQPRKVKELQK